MIRQHGTIPKDWAEFRIKELAWIDNETLGANTSGDYRFKYISLSEVKEGVIDVNAPIMKFSEAPSRARRKVRKDDVLMSTVRPNLEGFCRIRNDEKDLIASTGFSVLTPKTPSDSEYLYQYLFSHAIRSQVYALVVGSGYPAINSSDVASMKVLAPRSPLHREAISHILAEWDSGARVLVSALESRLNWIEWFRRQYLSGKKRISGFNEKWSRTQLRSILFEHGESSTGKEAVYSVSVHEGLVNQIEHLGRSFAAATTDHYNLVKPGDIVYTKSPTGDFPLGIIKQSKVDKNVIVSPLYGVFTPKTRELGVLLDCYFESPANAFNYLHPIVQRGAKNTISITNKRFLSNSLLLPTDPEEQKALAGIVELAKREIRLLERQVEAYRRQKRGLMQKLLTGEWRVKS